MQKAFKLAAVAALSSAAMAAQAGVAFDANIETNTDFQKKNATTDTVSNGGRVEVNANAQMMKSGDFFVNAKGTLGLKLSGGDTYVDDAWIQVGNSSADLKIGRFEGADLFPLGKDVAPNIRNEGYNGGALRGRHTDGRLHAAVNAKLGGGLGLEVGLVTEKQAGGASYGLRPVVKYSAGPMSLAAGIEAITADGSGASSTGVAVTLGYALSKDTSVNVNFAKNSKMDKSAIGVNATFGAAGVGFVQGKNDAASMKSTSVYAAYTLPLFGIKGASITPAVSVTKLTGSSSSNALRVRLNYGF